MSRSIQEEVLAALWSLVGVTAVGFGHPWLSVVYFVLSGIGMLGAVSHAGKKDDDA